MRVITTRCKNCDGMMFISTTDDTTLSLLEFKRKLNHGGPWCKIAFVETDLGERQLAVVHSLWSLADGNRWASFIKHDLVRSNEYVACAVQW